MTMPNHATPNHATGTGSLTESAGSVTYDEPVQSPVFASGARNAEDVVVWRALGHLPRGRSVEIGARDAAYSVTRALGERGWTAEVVTTPAELAGLPRAPLHVLAASGVAAAAAALDELPADARPWVIVSSDADGADPAPEPARRAVADAGYAVVLDDGGSTYFLHADHVDELAAAFAYPASTRDRYITAEHRALLAERDRLSAELAEASASVVHWRATALHRWQSGAAVAHVGAAQRELEAMRRTISWRVTRPLRAVRRRLPARRRLAALRRLFG